MDTKANDISTQEDFGTAQPAGSSSGDKQQVVSYLQNAKNVLITVSSNPSVDELAAALGLTFLLNRLDKHATTVFSGKIPPAMEFLDPEKTFEDNVDSLRDFIIALDKEKADKLRYKVEEDVVKIFITPYKTTLKKEDFEFSQGDFNVDVVVALGVSKRDDLDKAITAHGRILHDATVVTINTIQSSSLGVVDLLDSKASSISETIVAMAESFGGGLLDEQSSTALLTGIVAATNRFSNEKTSPKVMTMAAQLMAAGANQQLIASNLRHEGVISEEIRKNNQDSTIAQPSDDGELSLDHGDKKRHKPSSGGNPTPKQSSQKSTGEEPKIVGKAQPAKVAPSQEQPSVLPPLEIPMVESAAPAQVPTEEVAPLSPPAVPPAATPPQAALPEIKKDERRPETEKPAFGGTLNATTSDAEQAKREAALREANLNKIALSHEVEEESNEQAEALTAARQAVEEAASIEEFDPANQPIESVGAQPIAAVPSEPSQPAHQAPPAIAQRQMVNLGQAPAQPAPQEAEVPEPMDAFMQTHVGGPALPSLPSQQMTAAPPQTPAMSPAQPAPQHHQMMPTQPQSAAPSMPPLPPPLPGDGTLPPMPQIPPPPGQAPSAAVPFQPQTSPDFMQSVNQSQNPWTEAGQNLAAQQANKDVEREQKMQQMTQQYDAAVDKNRELQGLPPVNNANDHTVFPLPPASL